MMGRKKERGKKERRKERKKGGGEREGGRGNLGLNELTKISWQIVY